jgi:endonuclease/exonuclease/phosphatase family metal-dependent hydrolase
VAGSATAAEVQRRQAAELIDGPAATPLPVVLLGDFNARPGRPAHAALLAAGFDDAWARANPDGPAGLTCCHRMPLDDPADRLRARIDHVFTRGALQAVEAFVVGDEFGAGPLWASDHAGVVARLEPRRYVGPS